MGYKLVLPPPPYGGAVVTLVLNILERYNLPKLGYDIESVHYLVEALKYYSFVIIIFLYFFFARFGFSDRLTLGDPAFEDLSDTLPDMLDKDHAAMLRQRINQVYLHNQIFAILMIIVHRISSVSLHRLNG